MKTLPFTPPRCLSIPKHVRVNCNQLIGSPDMKKMAFFILYFLFSQITYSQGTPSPSLSTGTSPQENTAAVSPRFEEVSKWSDALDLQAWTTYADSLKDCKVGTFTLINPLSMAGELMVAITEPAGLSIQQDEFTKKIIDKSMNYQILGLQGDKCQVKMNIPADPDLPPDFGSAKILNCSISQSDLAAVSQGAKIIAAHKVQEADSNGAGDAASAAILSKACVQAH